jgi:RHS repeat-associated protein
MTDESGVSTYEYDKNNRLLRIVKDGAERIAYTYDELGNIASVKDAKGFTTSYTYDKSSRMETVTFQGKITTYRYDDNGNRTAIVYGGGVTEEYTFDRNDRLVELINKRPDGSVLSSYRYTYDAAGQLTSKTDDFGTTDYTYDEVGRILRVDAPGRTTAYAYDRAGNRQSLMETYTSAQPSGYVDPGTKQEVTYRVKKSEYVYSPTNQLLKLVETMFDDTGAQVLEKTVAYLYDDNGNELRQQASYLRPHQRSMRQVAGGSLYGDEQTDAELNVLIEKMSSTFDGFNRLKKTERLKAGERVTVEYVYDGDDLRTRKTVRSSAAGYEAQVTNYYYDRQHVILETNGADQASVRYARGLNYIARIDAAAGRLSYFLYNGHGDVVQTVSETGDVENQYDYDVFGNPTLTMETEYTTAIRYAGEFYDAEVGLYYLRARYYNPYTGRFISEDSYWGEDTNPLSLNLYTYAHNNPILYVDPTGHSAKKYDTSYEAYQSSGARGYISYEEFVRNVEENRKDRQETGGFREIRKAEPSSNKNSNSSSTGRFIEIGIAPSNNDYSPESSSSSFNQTVDIELVIFSFLEIPIPYHLAYPYITRWTDYNNRMDDISEENEAELLALIKQKLAEREQKEIERDRKITKLIEYYDNEMRWHSELKAEVDAYLEHNKKLKAQLGEVGEDIDKLKTQSDKIVEHLRSLLEQYKIPSEQAEEIVKYYKNSNNVELTESESYQPNLVTEVIIGFALELWRSGKDTYDFAVFAIEDPIGAGKAVVDNAMDTAQQIWEMVTDPQATYEDVKQAVEDFSQLSKQEQARAFGAFLTNFSPTTRSKLFLPDGRGSRGHDGVEGS